MGSPWRGHAVPDTVWLERPGSSPLPGSFIPHSGAALVYRWCGPALSEGQPIVPAGRRTRLSGPARLCRSAPGIWPSPLVWHESSPGAGLGVAGVVRGSLPGRWLCGSPAWPRSSTVDGIAGVRGRRLGTGSGLGLEGRRSPRRGRRLFSAESFSECTGAASPSVRGFGSGLGRISGGLPLWPRRSSES